MPTEQPHTHDTDSAVELHSAMTDSLRRAFGLSESAASALADDVVMELRREYACTRFYVPAPSREQRNALIRRHFTGHNHHELARRYGISERQVRNILGQAREGAVRECQEGTGQERGGRVA